VDFTKGGSLPGHGDGPQSSRDAYTVPMRAPERIETARLVLRRPTGADAEAMFERYASDAEVTRWLGWPRHRSLDDTRLYLAWSDAQWRQWPAGPYAIEARAYGRLLGGTGFAFESATMATTGYVLARDAWGLGYATEALRAMADLAPALGVRRLVACCHPEHAASERVLAKCGFLREGTRPVDAAFPNLAPGRRCDVAVWSLAFGP
jgi:RimJ/RimL family protein N-acetyltransferase